MKPLIMLLGSAFILSGVLGFTVVSQASGQASPRALAAPNILLIVSDDAGYADFGFNGRPGMPTPNLDALARRGAVLTQAYVSASVCSPSRAGLITGRYQQRFGHHHNLSGPTAGLPLDEVTMADHLKAAGYTTWAIGKWHLGSSDEQHPMSRGFDGFDGLLSGSRSYWPIENPSRGQVLRNGREAIDETGNPYLTRWMGARAEAVIRERAGADHPPLFMSLSFTAPHGPMDAPGETISRFSFEPDEKRRTYLAMQAEMDTAIGGVLQALEDAGIADQTLIVFVNDNGGATSNGSDNGLLRGMKGSNFEGGCRVPMLMSWPNRLAPFTTYGHPVSTLDLLPTFLAAAGAEPIDESAPLDGIDLIPYLTRQTDERPHETLYWKRSAAESIRHGDWKLIRIDDGYRLLFDLAADPGETVNLMRDRPEIAADLEQRLDAWVSELVEPLWFEGEHWEDLVRRKHRDEVRGREAERSLP